MMIIRIISYTEYYACIEFDGHFKAYNAQFERFPFLRGRLKSIQKLFYRSHSPGPLDYIIISLQEYKRLEVLKYADIDKLCKN
jgi:hypothetical protein